MVSVEVKHYVYLMIMPYLKLLWHCNMHWLFNTWSYYGIVRHTDHTIPEATMALWDTLIIPYLKLLWHCETLIIPYLKLLWHCETHWSYHTWSYYGTVRHTDHTIPEATVALWDALIIPYLKLLWHCEMHWSYHTWSYCGIVRCTDHTIPETVKAKRS